MLENFGACGYSVKDWSCEMRLMTRCEVPRTTRRWLHIFLRLHSALQPLHCSICITELGVVMDSRSSMDHGSWILDLFKLRSVDS